MIGRISGVLVKVFYVKLRRTKCSLSRRQEEAKNVFVYFPSGYPRLFNEFGGGEKKRGEEPKRTSCGSQNCKNNPRP